MLLLVLHNVGEFLTYQLIIKGLVFAFTYKDFKYGVVDVHDFNQKSLSLNLGIYFPKETSMATLVNIRNMITLVDENTINVICLIF